MKEQILKLNDEGKSYDQIVEILGCTEEEVAYHCGLHKLKSPIPQEEFFKACIKILEYLGYDVS